MSKLPSKKGLSASAGMPEISVVVPIYNEEETLQLLYNRLMPVMDGLGRSYEVIFVNDGSVDDSRIIMQKLHKLKPQNLRIVNLVYNVGQYMALMAGLEHARGEVVVTLDADLQNPPEEIPNLLAKIDEGHDLVGSYRANRQDNFYRRYVSQFVNIVREKLTGLKMEDHGCMLRAYRRSVVDAVLSTHDTNVFINALAQKFSGNPVDIMVKHEERSAGESKYNFYKLARLGFDLVTGFSLAPIQIYTLAGLGVSFLSFLLVVYMLIRRVVVGPEAEGVFTLLAVVIFLISIAIVGIGIVGEYVGRTYQSVVRRPRYLVKDRFENIEGQ